MADAPIKGRPDVAWPIARDLAIAILLVLLAFGASLAWSQEPARLPTATGPYRGIATVEVFTNVGTNLRLPKNPPFALKVYRMDAFQAMNQALEDKTPHGLTYDQKKAWQDEYVKAHKAEFDRWTDMVGQAMAGGERLERLHLRIRVNPGVVINDGQWATQGEPDLDKVIAQFQKERKQ